ncbi:LOW QUALITY PROTEIN: hypothetical protein Cgig2_020179 [Carnegiea gigantea]|uniref:Uncharacterized protein n=1 Tax=Carnegiea gigantea TaxID=171969 RepID=A0A9Q1KXU0_9CARY|nr:LOW QUALITY PROTEIN: hypothetical protein Cgig2_020179 [Carnegiea gigantea]
MPNGSPLTPTSQRQGSRFAILGDNMEGENQIFEMQLEHAKGSDPAEDEDILEESSLANFSEQNLRGENHTEARATQAHMCAENGTTPDLDASVDCIVIKETGPCTPLVVTHVAPQQNSADNTHIRIQRQRKADTDKENYYPNQSYSAQRPKPTHARPAPYTRTSNAHRGIITRPTSQELLQGIPEYLAPAHSRDPPLVPIGRNSPQARINLSLSGNSRQPINAPPLEVEKQEEAVDGEAKMCLTPRHVAAIAEAQRIGLRIFQLPLMTHMNNSTTNTPILAWNVQGARSKGFRITLKEIVRKYSPKILLLVETRISGITADEYVTIEVLEGDSESWILSAIYGSPNEQRRTPKLQYSFGSSILEGIQKKLAQTPNRFLAKLEVQLKKELDEVLSQIELLWFQKSREDAIRDGDRNARYYHLSTIIRRKFNRIDSIQDANGNWLGKGPLCNAITELIPPTLAECKVADMWDENRGWKWEKFADRIPPEYRKIIASQSIRGGDEYEDQIVWNDSSSDGFSIASALKIIS